MRALILIGLLCIASTAWAGLIGTSVTGSLLIGGNPPNYYDPAYTYVPASGYLNSSPGGPTVTIAEPAIEFGFADGANTDKTNFTNTQLIFTDASLYPGNAAYTLTFTDSAFNDISLVSTTFAGMTYSINDDTHTIAINIPAFDFVGTQTATFNIASGGGGGATPEPATLWLFGAGLALMGVRRFCWSR
jgi:hypothetical protein